MKKSLDIFCYNARSLLGDDRRKAFGLFCDKNNFDVIFVCETWLHEEILDSEIPLPNYTLYRHERKVNMLSGHSAHGGVLVAVKTDFCSVPEPKTLEGVVSCVLKLPNEPVDLLLVCVYNPPDDSVYRFSEDHLIAVIEYLVQNSKRYHVFCYGDFNLKEIDWNAMASENYDQQKFLEYLFENNLRQHVDFPTRSSNILDLVITSFNVKLGELCTFKKKVSPKSDHVALSYNLYLSQDNFKYRENARSTYSFRTTDFIALSQFLRENSCVHNCWSNPDVLAYYWKEWFWEAISRVVPKRTKHRSNLNPWVSTNSSNLIKKIATLERCIKPPVSKLLRLKSQLNCQLEQDLTLYQRNLAESRSADKLFKLFRLLRRCKMPPLLQYGKFEARTDIEKARLFAEFFQSVFNPSSKPIYSVNDEIEILESFELSETLVASHLKEIDASKATGPDGIPPVLLKEMNRELSHSLYTIFKKIRQTCVYPKVWKCATIIPVHKKSSKIEVMNYRPVSLLSCVSKVFERCVYSSMYKFLRPRFSDCQHGFRKGRSCVTQLLHYLDLVFKGIDSGSNVEIVYTDFEKAFDKVDHGILLSKLYRLGVRGKLLQLLESYLSERTYRVKVGDSLSTPRLVTSGVPQGSLLGPLLFLVIINDFADCCEFTSCFLCADDAKLVYVGNEPSVMQLDIDNIALWCFENNMFLNADKCTHLSIGKSCEYFLDGDKLKLVTKQKDLGLIIEDSLKWHEHIAEKCHKAMSVLMMIKRNCRMISLECKKNMFKTMVLPILSYGSPCWFASVEGLKRLEQVQKYAVIWMIGKSHYKTGLLTTNLLPISLYLQLSDLLTLSKFMNGQYDITNDNFVQLLSPNRETRYSTTMHFVVPLVRRALSETNFWIRCPKLVNRLPTSVDFFQPIGLKARLLRFFWNYFRNTYDPDVTHTWRF